jgi:signal recognition particle receptor subunit alpha
VITAGVVLWSKSFTPAIVEDLEKPDSPVDALIRQTFVEERTADQKFDKDSYTVRWSFANDLELIFVVSEEQS